MPSTSTSVSASVAISAIAASAGPTVVPISRIEPYSESAAGTRSEPTRLGMPERIAGWNSPAPSPPSSASATVASIEPTNAIPISAAARARSATTAHVRRDQRSAAAPKIGPSSVAGTKSASRTSVMPQAPG
jgi:hypothetical protein